MNTSELQELSLSEQLQIEGGNLIVDLYWAYIGVKRAIEIHNGTYGQDGNYY